MRYFSFAVILVLSVFFGAIAGIAFGELLLFLGMGDPWDAIGGFAAAGVAIGGILLGFRAYVRRAFKKCSQCAAFVRAEAKRCVYCRADI